MFQHMYLIWATQGNQHSHIINISSYLGPPRSTSRSSRIIWGLLLPHHAAEHCKCSHVSHSFHTPQLLIIPHSHRSFSFHIGKYLLYLSFLVWLISGIAMPLNLNANDNILLLCDCVCAHFLYSSADGFSLRLTLYLDHWELYCNKYGYAMSDCRDMPLVADFMGGLTKWQS